jgi:hypothetical protein
MNPNAYFLISRATEIFMIQAMNYSSHLTYNERAMPIPALAEQAMMELQQAVSI